MKAIGTIYKNVRFRSRLEARWAVFFDEYGLEWEYEPETFKLKNEILYAPDFYLPNLKCYAEVKPKIKKPTKGYNIFKIDDNYYRIKPREQEILKNFELSIILLIGLPLEETWKIFNDGEMEYLDHCVYPCYEGGYWRWWSTCGDVNQYPNHRDIKEPAKIAREYDFFKF